MLANLLVIEDNVDVRENLVELLELSSYHVVAASNGKEGVEKALEHKPDLIICDIMMPEMDGYGVLYRLSRNKDTSKIPFIFLTAKTDTDDIRRGMNEGADDYITKPFNEIDLLKAIESRLKKSESVRQEQGVSVQISSIHNLSQQIMAWKDMALFEQQNYEKNTCFVRDGKNLQRVYFIEKGQIKKEMTNSDGKTLLTDMLGSEEIIGIEKLFNPGPNPYSYTTVTECTLYSISFENLLGLMQSKPEILTGVLNLLSKNIENRDQELIDMAYQSVRKRVATCLLQWSEKFADENGYFKLKRDDLAHHVGTSSETAIRVLTDFKESNWIEAKGRSVKLIEIGKLQNAPI